MLQKLPVAWRLELAPIRVAIALGVIGGNTYFGE